MWIMDHTNPFNAWKLWDLGQTRKPPEPYFIIGKGSPWCRVYVQELLKTETNMGTSIAIPAPRLTVMTAASPSSPLHLVL